MTPRSKRPGVGGQHGDALRVGVAVSPEAGKANAACLKALAAAFEFGPDPIQLDLASRHRRKRVRALGEPEKLERRFAELAASR